MGHEVLIRGGGGIATTVLVKDTSHVVLRERWRHRNRIGHGVLSAGGGRGGEGVLRERWRSRNRIGHILVCGGGGTVMTAAVKDTGHVVIRERGRRSNHILVLTLITAFVPSTGNNHTVAAKDIGHVVFSRGKRRNRHNSWCQSVSLKRKMEEKEPLLVLVQVTAFVQAKDTGYYREEGRGGGIAMAAVVKDFLLREKRRRNHILVLIQVT